MSHFSYGNLKYKYLPFKCRRRTKSIQMSLNQEIIKNYKLSSKKKSKIWIWSFIELRYNGIQITDNQKLHKTPKKSQIWIQWQFTYKIFLSTPLLALSCHDNLKLWLSSYVISFDANRLELENCWGYDEDRRNWVTLQTRNFNNISVLISRYFLISVSYSIANKIVFLLKNLKLS